MGIRIATFFYMINLIFFKFAANLLFSRNPRFATSTNKPKVQSPPFSHTLPEKRNSSVWFEIRGRQEWRTKEDE